MTTVQHSSTPGTRAAGRGVLPMAGVSAAALMAAGMLAQVDPNRPGHYPGCPFLAVTGLYCPGCGSLRAAHDLLLGDVAGALARNPLAVLAVPFLLFAFVAGWLRATGRRAPSPTQLPASLVWTLLVVVLGYGVLRNLPGWTWLSPV